MSDSAPGAAAAGVSTTGCSMMGVCSCAVSCPRLESQSGVAASAAGVVCSGAVSCPRLESQSGVAASAAGVVCSGAVSCPRLESQSGVAASAAGVVCSGAVSCPRLESQSGVAASAAGVVCSGAVSCPRLESQSGVAASAAGVAGVSSADEPNRLSSSAVREESSSGVSEVACWGAMACNQSGMLALSNCSPEKPVSSTWSSPANCVSGKAVASPDDAVQPAEARKSGRSASGICAVNSGFDSEEAVCVVGG